jgi:hypothetical protein
MDALVGEMSWIDSGQGAGADRMSGMKYKCQETAATGF